MTTHMSDQPEVQAGPVVKVARDLTAIIDLSVDLREQAINDSNHSEMPGGDAMVALGPVANLEAWTNALATTEQTGHAYTDVDLEDPDDLWPPLQRLLFWSEDLRRELDNEWDAQSTIDTEAKFLKWNLGWLWDNEVRWDDFAKDVRETRSALESILTDGRRNGGGAPCLSCGTDLVRPSIDPRKHDHCDGHDGVCHLPHDKCPHDRGGLRDWWKCPNADCARWYAEKDYRLAVAHAHAAHAEYLPIEQVIELTNAKRGSIQGWATRERVAKQKDLETGRTLYRVDDVRDAMREVLAS